MLHTAVLLASAAILLTSWSLAVRINRQGVRGHDGTGDPGQGIVVFVEPVRWLFVIWGFTSFARGCRQGGSGQYLRLFRWGGTAGALLVIPDLVRRRRLERRARQLARFVDQLAAEHPESAIHLVGYSTGGYIALQACRYLRSEARVGSVVLLAASVSPDYAWDGLGERVGEVHSFHSCLDAINILGPLLFGGNDRKWGPACGAVGFKSPPEVVNQRGWRPADVRLGYWGDHFTITSPAFVAEEVVPCVGGR